MMNSVLQAGFAVASMCAVGHGGDAEAGLALLSQGKLVEARQYIARAYQCDSTDAAAVFGMATLCSDGVEAMLLYERVADDSAAAVSLRAEACMRTGDGRYCEGRFGDARQWYEKACRFTADPECSMRSGRCVKALARETMGQTDVAAAEESNQRAGASTFSIQVGAFSSLENARRLRDNLAIKFNDIYIVSAKSGKANLYKVRIGSFESADAANAFVEKKIKNEKLSFSVVKK